MYTPGNWEHMTAVCMKFVCCAMGLLNASLKKQIPFKFYLRMLIRNTIKTSIILNMLSNTDTNELKCFRHLEQNVELMLSDVRVAFRCVFVVAQEADVGWSCFSFAVCFFFHR